MSQSVPTVAVDPAIEHRRRTWVLVLAVLALTFPAAYISGVILLRWGDPVNLTQHLALLAHVPDRLGEWQFVAEGTAVSPEVVEKLELRGNLHRIYEHPVTGQHVSLLLLVGPAGPLVRHPPEVCYETGANDLQGSQMLSIEANGHQDRLRLLSYRSDSLVDGDFLVAYGFGADQHWDCPSSPRMTYGGRPVLYKLQVLTEAAGETTDTRPEGLIDFLSQLLPALDAEMVGERNP